ncbi:nuclear nucleic acid-binding protein C1D isoform X3 [Bubalus kerabau]|uniref:nuclear nucleic acid-binding protein C1D isoform X3 n=1 Tax=Bubalus carabanensis TaxID=3119969 RepID=UPI00244E6256|nr:nuclear nucleic acid-binding protein C1D isoform X3 [Bubalus carabanensis]
MAGEGINEDYPVEIHEYLSTFENSIGAVDEMLKTMMSVSRNELLQKLDPLEQAKVDLVSAYTLNSMFWVYLATQGVNPKEHPVKQELVLLFSDEFYQSACRWKCVWSPGGCLLCLPPGEMKKLGTHPVALKFPVFLDSALSRKKVYVFQMFLSCSVLSELFVKIREVDY